MSNIIILEIALKNAVNIDKGIIRWDQILEVIVGEDCAFLYMTDLDAIIIPRHGLQDVGDWGRLIDLIEEKSLYSLN